MIKDGKMISGLLDYFEKKSDKSDGIYLEVGPLDRPFIDKEDYNVRYLDFRTTDEIKKVYKDSYADLNKIVDIDYATHGKAYSDVVGSQRFRGVYSSHCLEHTYDGIGHLIDVANILEDDGYFVIKIPDGDSWFDHYRQPNTFREAYSVYKGCGLNQLLADSYINTKAYYEGKDIVLFREKEVSFINELINERPVLDVAKKIIESENIYTPEGSPHIWVFTTESFLELYKGCLRYNLIPFSLEEYSGPGKDLHDGELKVVFKKNTEILKNDKLRLIETIKVQIEIEKLRGESGAKIVKAVNEGKNIYVYGNGYLGKMLKKVFEDIYSISVGIVVSDEANDADKTGVTRLSELTNKDGIFFIIGTSNRRFVKQMEMNLINAGYVINEDYVTM